MNAYLSRWRVSCSSQRCTKPSWTASEARGPDPSAPGCRTGADGPDIRPRGGEGDEGIVYPPITSDNVHGVVGKDYRKKNYPAETKHVFWAHMECGLVLSSVTPWELIPKTKGETRGGTCASTARGTGAPGEGAPASSRSGPARPSFSWCWTSRRMACTTTGQGTVGVLPPGRALCPAARCLRG